MLIGALASLPKAPYLLMPGSAFSVPQSVSHVSRYLRAGASLRGNRRQLKSSSDRRSAQAQLGGGRRFLQHTQRDATKYFTRHDAREREVRRIEHVVGGGRDQRGYRHGEVHPEEQNDGSGSMGMEISDDDTKQSQLRERG